VQLNLEGFRNGTVDAEKMENSSAMHIIIGFWLADNVRNIQDRVIIWRGGIG
jgi:hypothetical protein